MARHVAHTHTQNSEEVQTTIQMEGLKEKIPYGNNVRAEKKIILKTVLKYTPDSSEDMFYKLAIVSMIINLPLP